jgi:beta-lactamase superfamily II metal-dependent hydrolase
MELVMNEPRQHYDVLLAPHHGSGSSRPAVFSDWSKPDWVIISGGSADGRLARPAYEANGATVLNTADCGAVSVTIAPDRFDVQPFHAARQTAGPSIEDVGGEF